MRDPRADRLEYFISLCKKLGDGPSRMEPWPHWGHHSRRGRNDRYKNVDRTAGRGPGPAVRRRKGGRRGPASGAASRKEGSA